jgi:hypothetical protein
LSLDEPSETNGTFSTHVSVQGCAKVCLGVILSESDGSAASDEDSSLALRMTQSGFLAFVTTLALQGSVDGLFQWC